MDTNNTNPKIRRFNLSKLGDAVMARVLSESFSERTRKLLNVVETGLPVVIGADQRDDELVLKTLEPPEPIINVIRDHQGLEPASFIKVADQLVSGSAYLHEQDISIGRIELEDIFWNGELRNPRAAICNAPFGEFSFLSNQQLTDFISHSGSFAPESPNRDTKANKKTDQFFLGRVLCQLAGGRKAVDPQLDTSEWTKRVPSQVRGPVQRLIAESPNERFADMESAKLTFEKNKSRRSFWNLLPHVAAVALCLAFLGCSYLLYLSGQVSSGNTGADNEKESQIVEMKEQITELKDRIKNLESDLARGGGPQAPTSPSEKQIFETASRIFRKLASEESKEGSQDTTAAELAKLPENLRKAVQGKLAIWKTRMSHESTWTLVFETPSNLPQGVKLEKLYSILRVDDDESQYSQDEGLASVKFKWKAGEKIELLLKINDNTPFVGYDSTITTLKFDGYYALFQLIERGVAFKTDSGTFRFSIDEWDNSLPQPALPIPSL